MQQTQYDVIIIGAGHNGLVCASYLAKGGLSVLVLERLPRSGGAIVSEQIHPGFTAPYCPYVCHMFQGKVIEDLDLPRYGYSTYNYDPMALHPFPDGSYILAWQDDHKTYEAIRRISEPDARAFLEWTTFWERAGGILYRYFFSEPPTFAQVTADVRGTRDEEVWETMLTVSVRDLVEQYFEDERVKAFCVDAQDMGDPSAPGSVLSVAYIFWVRRFNKPQYFGIPKGGMSKVAEALAASAQAHGVTIRTDARVEKVLVQDGVVRGVRLATGEEIRSFMVVSNADPKRTYLRLVDAQDLDEAFRRRITNLTTRANCVKFLAALRELPDFSRYLGPGFDPKLITYIRICPSVDYFQESWDACKKGQPSMHPLLRIQIPSIWDPALAPRGMHVLSSWTLYYPTTPKSETWDQASKRVAENIIDTISEYAPNFRDSLLAWTLQTPQDIEAHTGMTDGSIRHIDVVPSQYFSRRVPYRAPIQHLYLCGSGTHPGGEISGAPGHNCAQAILQDLQQVVTQ
jgi:phytoene dehydrogenase-like protein